MAKHDLGLHSTLEGLGGKFPTAFKAVPGKLWRAVVHTNSDFGEDKNLFFTAPAYKVALKQLATFTDRLGYKIVRPPIEAVYILAGKAPHETVLWVLEPTAAQGSPGSALARL